MEKGRARRECHLMAVSMVQGRRDVAGRSLISLRITWGTSGNWCDKVKLLWILHTVKRNVRRDALSPNIQHPSPNMLYASLCAFFQIINARNKVHYSKFMKFPKILCISITLLFHLQQINPIVADVCKLFSYSSNPIHALFAS